MNKFHTFIVGLGIFALTFLGALGTAQAGTFCLCHNVKNPAGGTEVCAGNLSDAVSGHQDHLDIDFDLLGKCDPLGCGDGELGTDPNSGIDEECDDGNNTNGDGCNENCRFETCGDGVINNNNTEECDGQDLGNCTEGCTESCMCTVDQCPENPDKNEPGDCGCDTPDTDSDTDGTPDCNDNCPQDPDKTEPGICDCGTSDVDGDSDGTPDCNDRCPGDPDKIEEGVCGCGAADVDSDKDGTLDCEDLCPEDPDKTQPETCGCGFTETDGDEDGTPDCEDNCPEDPDKTNPGLCGCGTADEDSDDNGITDCQDPCFGNEDPNDPVCGSPAPTPEPEAPVEEKVDEQGTTATQVGSGPQPMFFEGSGITCALNPVAKPSQNNALGMVLLLLGGTGLWLVRRLRA